MRLLRYIALENFNRNFVELFKHVLVFDLQPHPGARTLGFEIMMWMQTLKGYYGPNMNALWSAVTEVYIIGETLTKNFLIVTELRKNELTNGKTKLYSPQLISWRYNNFTYFPSVSTSLNASMQMIFNTDPTHSISGSASKVFTKEKRPLMWLGPVVQSVADPVVVSLIPSPAPYTFEDDNLQAYQPMDDHWNQESNTKEAEHIHEGTNGTLVQTAYQKLIFLFETVLLSTHNIC